MQTVRTIAFAAAIAAGVLTMACGGAGSGGNTSATPTTAPALGTNKPAASGDPYSDTGY